MNNKFLSMSFILIPSLWLNPNLAQAKIFKCINQKGSVYYKDKPCPVLDKETELQAVKDPKNGYIPKVGQGKQEEARLKAKTIADKISIKGKTVQERGENKNEKILTKSVTPPPSNADNKTANSFPKSGSLPSIASKPKPSFSKRANKDNSNENHPIRSGKKIQPPGIVD